MRKRGRDGVSLPSVAFCVAALIPNLAADCEFVLQPFL